MNPTAAEMLKGIPRNHKAMMPPVSASGTPLNTIRAYFTSLKLLVAGDISAGTRETLMKQIDEANASDSAAKVVGMILGTPEFQRQ